MDKIIVVYDAELMRPGCALLQSLMGGTPGIANSFNSDHWLIEPTEHLKPYRMTPDQLLNLIERTERQNLHCQTF